MTGDHIQYAKKKFPALAWSIIRNALEGWCGEIHHECGKQYEYLATLRPMSLAEHKPNGTHCGKYMFGLPAYRRAQNLKFWRELLGEDYDYFVKENLEG